MSTLTHLNGAGFYSMTYHDDYMLDEFIAMGGVTNDTELADFLQNTLLEGQDVTINPPNFGCSTFSGELTNGDRIFARNFDYSDAPLLVVTTSPQNGYRSISTVNLAFLEFEREDDILTHDNRLAVLAAPYLPLDGINEKGLAIGVLQINFFGAKQTAPGKVNVTTTIMIRLILDNAATIDEAVELMREYNMHDSLGVNFHYQIADRSGKSVVVEYINNELVVVEQTEGKNYHSATNFLLHSNALGTSIITGGNFPSSIRPTFNCWRYNTMQTALVANGGIFADKQEAMDLLEAVNNNTQWSVVYNLDKLTAMFVPSIQFSQPAFNFAL
jgi:hypothetical protein